jgi:hypothetical protein
MPADIPNLSLVPLQARDLEKEHPMESAPTAHLLSLDARRRNNVAYVEDDVLVMAAGNNVVFLKLPNMVSGTDS